jgi:dihydropteroate synthase
LGVINITPNSFSDPNLFLNSNTLIQTLNNFKTNPYLCFDFGFESTAPANAAISESLEKERFDAFFESIKDVDLSGRWISFDTYKVQNYLYFEEQFKSRYRDCGFIFNDVSGVINEDLLSLLKSKKSDQNFYYLYTYTHIPSRELVLNHMNYILEGDIVEMSFKHFSHGYEKFKVIGFQEKIIFDPCFGFSKSYEQNWDLLNRFDQLVHKLSEQNQIRIPWLIGVSKKSFLRKSLVNSSDPFKDSEILHAEIIKNLQSKKLGHLLFRVHDPKLVVL